MIEIEIHELFRFFRHPQRYFFNQKLGIWFDHQEAKAEEREPFAIGKLEGYGLYQDWLAADLNDRQLSVQKMQARGLWPSGVAGETLFHRQQQVISDFADRIREKNLGDRLDDLPVDITIGSYRLTGKLSNRYENGVLLYRYANLKGKDFVIALLHHLIAQQEQPQTTHLLSAHKDKKEQYKDYLAVPPDVVDAQQHLHAWLNIYQQGCQHPHAFFVEAAFEYVQQHYKLVKSKQAKTPALDKAKAILERAINQDYEPEFQLLGRHIQDVSDILNADFEQHCQDLLQPVWNAIQVKK